VARDPLDHELVRSGRKTCRPQIVFLVRREQHDAGLGPQSLDLARRRDAVEHGHADVHDDRIWLKVATDGDGLTAVCARGDDLEPVLRQECDENVADGVVVVAICVNHQVGASSLDQRCRGFAAALARAGGRSRVLTVDLQSQSVAERRIAAAASSSGVDGVLTLGPGGATPALEAFAAKRLFGKVKLATFDLAPDILRGLRSRKLLFAIDQQPFLQGYLPVLFLTQRKLYGLIPADGTVIPTGPNFVTPANAALVQQLTSAGIRG
jgi:ABC-type sugar transport system substrate-binding protein